MGRKELQDSEGMKREGMSCQPDNEGPGCRHGKECDERDSQYSQAIRTAGRLPAVDVFETDGDTTDGTLHVLSGNVS